jgi:hypothetical protein
MERVNLHSILERNAFDHAVICTFTFEPLFFEDYCLDRFRSLAENNNITIILDRRTYDQIIHAPASEWPRLANLRYLLHPIAVPGAFHPKLFLFANRDKGLLFIGSANFTKPGLTSNAELVGVYRYERGKHERYLGLFRQAMQFLSNIAKRWVSWDLESNLRDVLHDAEWLAPDPGEPSSPLRLIHNLDRPLWEQIYEGLPTPIDAVHVLSRYFDAEPSALTRIREDVKPRKLVLWTENGITTMTPAWFGHPAVREKIVSIRDLTVLDDDHRQPLHAKAMALIRGKTIRLAFGSANFTNAGLFLTSGQGNVELMVILDELPLASCPPKRLFDPSGTGRDLLDVNQLRTAPRELRPELQTRPPIELHEASLSDLRLTCRCTIPGDIPASAEVKAVLTFGDGGELHLGIFKNANVFIGDLDDIGQKRCSEGTTMTHVEAVLKGAPPLLSNRTLLVNLKDIETGRSQRRERRIREAQKSAEQFAAMLGELLQLGETDALKTFLTHCDIPIINAGRPFFLRGARPQWEGADVWRILGDRNLRVYLSLHDAAMGFCERHIRRMQRHCKHASTAGIPNFMHIALAIGNVLRAQVERALVGVETLRISLTIDEWYQHRQRLEQYLTEFRKVIDILNDEYLPALQKLFKAPAIREAIYPDLQPLSALCATFLRVRDRIEACRSGALRVRNAYGQLGMAQIFDHDLLAPARW